MFQAVFNGANLNFFNCNLFKIGKKNNDCNFYGLNVEKIFNKFINVKKNHIWQIQHCINELMNEKKNIEVDSFSIKKGIISL